MMSRSKKDMVEDYQAMPGSALDLEIKWFKRMLPVLQRQLAAALLARRRQRRKAASS